MTRANVSDRDGASAMIALHAMHLRQVQNVLVDGGYSGVNFQLDVASNLNATVQVAKRNELHRFEVMPQRWVVERKKLRRLLPTIKFRRKAGHPSGRLGLRQRSCLLGRWDYCFF